MTQDKYYHVQNEAEYNWLMKKLEREGYKWAVREKPTEFKPGSSFDAIKTYESSQRFVWSLKRWFPEEHFIEVSTLMKQDEKIYMTSEEKNEFNHLKDRTTLYAALYALDRTNFHRLWYRIFYPNSKQQNIKQIEFARAWANPDLIVVKKPERWAYCLKPEFQKLYHVIISKYLDESGNLHTYPTFLTKEQWQQVDNKIKVAFKRVYEEQK